MLAILTVPRVVHEVVGRLAGSLGTGTGEFSRHRHRYRDAENSTD